MNNDDDDDILTHFSLFLMHLRSVQRVMYQGALQMMPVHHPIKISASFLVLMV